jgi:thiosulfate/3-mercaptopyruvate sulfurtransferase
MPERQKREELQSDEPWDASELLAPVTLAFELKTIDPARHILYVGPRGHYKGTHIPKAVLAGPITKQKGLDLLTETLKNVPHDAEIIIYCGCRPMITCPNIRPAYSYLKQMGYTRIKVLKLNTGLDTDWVEKDFPIELSTK